MGVKDSFDPTWQLPKPDDSVAGSYEAVPGKSADSKRPAPIAYKGDGTAQLRSAAETKHNSEVPSGGKGAQNKWPAGVSQFDPINLTPPAPEHFHETTSDDESNE